MKAQLTLPAINRAFKYEGKATIPDLLDATEKRFSGLMKNLKSSTFVLRFSSSYKRSVRFGSEWSRLVATPSRTLRLGVIHAMEE
jgi:hypothetical protein